MTDLSHLLDKLTVADSVAADSGSFGDELARTEFTIFECIADLGYFSWKVNSNTNYKALSGLKSKEEVLRHVDLKGKPNRLVPIHCIELPKRFECPVPYSYDNKFPYGQTDIACLHVASCHRGVDLDTVDFCFGGSTLEMLANKDTADAPYIVTRVPGKNAILVVKRKEYAQNCADVGFQFERYVTGKKMSDSVGPSEFVEHLHLVKVGKYKVLFRAEADALTVDGDPVEIKVSNPRYWGTKVLFQMISNGSTKLCHGEKYRGVLSRVTLRSLSSVARDALQCSNVTMLQNNILNGMEAIHEYQLGEGEIRKIVFSRGSLTLPPTSSRSSVVLPPDDVVESLL